MQRPKKIQSSETSTATEKTITIQGLNSKWNQIFSKYADVDYITAMQSWYTTNPYVQNQRLKNLKSNPVFMDRETLEGDLKSPQNSELPLRQMSWSLLANTYPYYKLVRMYSDILTYKNYAYPKYVDKKDMDTPRFKSDSKIVNMLLDKFQPQYTFRRIALETFIEGKRAYVLRYKADFTTGKEKIDHFLLQELPSDWWKPVGKSDRSYYVPSFNFTYFWQPGTNVKQFPKEFENYYRDLMGCSRKDKKGKWGIDLDEVPESFDAEFKNGEWYLWHEIEDGFVFSADESNAWIVPTFTGLFLSAQDLQSYYLLQTQLASIPLYGLVTGEIPLSDQNKSGNYTNDMRISPDVVVGLTNQANSILPPGVSFFAAPFNNMKFEQFEEQVNSSTIYGSALKQFMYNSGAGGMFPMSDRPSVAQILTTQKIESRFADFMYRQFENFMNIVFEHYVELSFCWRFHIFGNVFEDKDRKQELKDALSMGQSYLLPEFLAYSDLDIESATSIMDMCDAFDIYDKMTVPQSAFQAGGQPQSKGGRPVKDDASVQSDATANSKDSGLNTGSMRNMELLNTMEFQEAVEEIVEQSKED